MVEVCRLDWHIAPLRADRWLDIWEPALALARANVAASPHAARIDIRAQDVTRLDEVAAYTLAWLPALTRRARASTTISPCLKRISQRNRSTVICRC